VDLYTKRCGNYAFGIASPQDGGIQSIHRLMPEWTEEEMVGEELESWILQRMIKIFTHEIGHMFGHKHCTFY